MTIRIKDFTKSDRAVSAIDGESVYAQVEMCFMNNEPVVLDFEGIELTITAFLNSSIGKLYSTFEVEKIKRLLSIVNLNKDELPLLKFVIEKAKERFGKDERNNDLIDEA